ncbi:integral membrane protein [Phlyctema vagabunda]|uniref:Integral membrane protein n=1 Tax=Phlyctema vagabunda TaxID=108571 RepID=A0ABR4PBZ7_9HELO
MQIPPPEVIVSWPASNYDSPSGRGPEGIIINLVLFPLMLLVVSLRIFTRCHLSRSFGIDDTLILVALVPTTAFMLLSVFAQVRLGIHRHIYDQPLSNVIMGLKLEIASETVFALATTATRLSMLALIRRILTTTSHLLNRLANIAMILMAIQGFIFCFIVIFQCRPPSDYWKLSVEPQPNCINRVSNLLVAGVVNTISDFIVVSLPIRPVCQLQLQSRQKKIVIGIFGAGFFVCCCGIARTVYTYRFTLSFDPTWSAYPVWITSCIELYVGIICASIPPTRLFFTRYMPVILGSTASNARLSQEPSNPAVSQKTQTGTEQFADLNEFPFLVDHNGGYWPAPGYVMRITPLRDEVKPKGFLES